MAARPRRYHFDFSLLSEEASYPKAEINPAYHPMHHHHHRHHHLHPQHLHSSRRPAGKTLQSQLLGHPCSAQSRPLHPRLCGSRSHSYHQQRHLEDTSLESVCPESVHRTQPGIVDSGGPTVAATRISCPVLSTATLPLFPSLSHSHSSASQSSSSWSSVPPSGSPLQSSMSRRWPTTQSSRSDRNIPISTPQVSDLGVLSSGEQEISDVREVITVEAETIEVTPVIQEAEGEVEQLQEIADSPGHLVSSCTLSSEVPIRMLHSQTPFSLPGSETSGICEQSCDFNIIISDPQAIPESIDRDRRFSADIHAGFSSSTEEEAAFETDDRSTFRRVRTHFIMFEIFIFFFYLCFKR
ncbi:unnamed protein product [Protopolystoma xenopodis]|uniref:Uncharacterized protein n=1 Tax=Protopolystoma xenopodis TaxID=117903 RepID=A0A3S5B1X6_9PLAT|nr:unnamed protein product [Protopolystoma xenopodis]